MKARLVRFGEIEVEGERYTHDVVIDGGKVRKRKKGDDFPVLHVDSILRFSSVQSGHMVSLGKLRADFPELASWTISNASSNEYRPASARRFVYP
jgi:hypothetical protein